MTDPSVIIRPHRISRPQKFYFTREELKSVLLNGDDNENNSLVIDFDGFVHLVPFEQAINGPYAVRYETFVAGNGYVGSMDSISYIEETYLSILESWLSHLESHDFEYRDYPNQLSEEEILKDIIKAIEEL